MTTHVGVLSQSSRTDSHTGDWMQGLSVCHWLGLVSVALGLFPSSRRITRQREICLRVDPVPDSYETRFEACTIEQLEIPGVNFALHR